MRRSPVVRRPTPRADAGRAQGRDVYLDLAPLTPDRPDYDPETELSNSALFDLIERHVIPVEVKYPTEQFLRLIDTYASHSGLEPHQRAALHARLRTAAKSELGSTVIKPYETCSYSARADELTWAIRTTPAPTARHRC